MAGEHNDGHQLGIVVSPMNRARQRALDKAVTPSSSAAGAMAITPQWDVVYLKSSNVHSCGDCEDSSLRQCWGCATVTEARRMPLCHSFT